ncbi:MAG: putative peptidoglycan O-acetyltransferase YrhL [Ilumatobacteraceae bacterium]|nr:putative peptidoglycan O-acetyltransferase YrhL [Ilumatobacteraceae bacterium]MCU1389213.1 putative peptidoglycan O-acetyltransferase YrhL [Ilumatobacteraceae bacterium]
MVGDSLTVGSAPYQSSDFNTVGWSTAAVNAFNSRSIHRKEQADSYTGLTAVDAIRSLYGDTNTWVIALGTNDCVVNPVADYEDVIVDMLGRIGATHRVLWINVHLPTAKSSETAWNKALLTVADAWQGEMRVYDWASLATAHPEWATGDHIHYHDAGYRYRAAVVAKASVQSFGAPAYLHW